MDKVIPFVMVYVCTIANAGVAAVALLDDRWPLASECAVLTVIGLLVMKRLARG